MRIGSLPTRFRNWFERCSALSALRKMQRADASYALYENGLLIDQIKRAAEQGNLAAALASWEALQVRDARLAKTSPIALRALIDLQQLDLVEAVLKDGSLKFTVSPDLMLLYAEVAQRRGDWLVAHQRWQAVCRRFPEIYWAYMWSARSLRELGRLDEANVLLQRAIRMAPDDLSLNVDYADIAEIRGDVAEALRRWRSAKDSIESVACWVGEARCLLKAGLVDEAVQTLTNARWRFDSRHEPSIELGWIHFNNNKFEEAAAEFQIVREKFPWMEVAYIGGAWALRDLGRLDEAEKILESYADRRDPQLKGLVEYARIAMGRNWAEAVRRWAVVREKFPNCAEGYIEGGDALEAIGEKMEADQLRLKKPADRGRYRVGCQSLKPSRSI